MHLKTYFPTSCRLFQIKKYQSFKRIFLKKKVRNKKSGETFFLWYSKPGNTKGGKYRCTIDLLFDWFGISCMTTDNFCFYLQNRLIQTSQTGGQRYSPPLVFPARTHLFFITHWSLSWKAPALSSLSVGTPQAVQGGMALRTYNPV